MKKDLTISSEANIKKAMEALEETSEKVLFVVDGNQKLIGSISDGDLRRHILEGHDLKDSISNAFNTDPIYVFEKDFDLEYIKKVLRINKIEVVPIVNDVGNITDYITWQKAFDNGEELARPKGQVSAPVVIMAGGKGTRLEPFTKVLPKPLIPIGDRPIIDLIIDRFVEYGMKEFHLVLNNMSKIIRAYFEDNTCNYSISFVEEGKPLGTVGGLKIISGRLNEPFFVSNCDIIVYADYFDLYRFHLEKNYDMSIVASVKYINIPYGTCELNDNGSLDEIKEKPEYSFLANTGLYIINPSVLALIPDSKPFSATGLIEKLKQDGGNIGVYPVSEKAWIDVGQWAEYKKAISVMEKSD